MKLINRDKMAASKAKTADKLQAKAVKKLAKLGRATDAVEVAAIAADLKGANAVGVIWIESDGSIGFEAKFAGRRRTYFWMAEEIGNLLMQSKMLFAEIDIVTKGGHAVTISRIEKGAAGRLYDFWIGTQK